MKKCNFCNQASMYYWKKSSGEKLDLCQQHYDDMEMTVHIKEKEERLAIAVIGAVSGREYDRIECRNGKDCKYCAQVFSDAK